MLVFLSGATALQLARPQVLFPSCCRTHGAHHCSVGVARQGGTPAWRGEGCPFANLSHAAILLVPYLPSSETGLARSPHTAHTHLPQQASLSAVLAALPGSRAPPSIL